MSCDQIECLRTDSLCDYHLACRDAQSMPSCHWHSEPGNGASAEYTETAPRQIRQSKSHSIKIQISSGDIPQQNKQYVGNCNFIATSLGKIDLQTLGPSHPERIQAPGCCFPTLIGHSSTSTTLGLCRIAWSLVSKIERPETSFKEPQEFVEIQVVYHIFGVPSHQYIFAAVPGLRLGSCFGRSNTWSTS